MDLLATCETSHAQTLRGTGKYPKHETVSSVQLRSTSVGKSQA